MVSATFIVCCHDIMLNACNERYRIYKIQSRKIQNRSPWIDTTFARFEMKSSVQVLQDVRDACYSGAVLHYRPLWIRMFVTLYYINTWKSKLSTTTHCTCYLCNNVHIVFLLICLSVHIIWILSWISTPPPSLPSALDGFCFSPKLAALAFCLRPKGII